VNDELFQELLESVREAGAIVRGETAPARAYSVSDPDVAEVRGAYGLSQSQFASLLGISIKTLQNWEQHRRRPEGAARVLLRVAARHPEAVLDVVHEDAEGTAILMKAKASRGHQGRPYRATPAKKATKRRSTREPTATAAKKK
jgi:putative transcriptional regulator